MGATSDREVAVDAAAIVAVSVAICARAQDLALMSLVVGAAWLLRLAGWALVHRRDLRALAGEVAFCLLATALGALNDWTSVDRHHVYRYLVPTDLPAISTLPAWMLAYWGLILRFVATLAAWRRLGDDAAPSDLVRLGRRRRTSAPLKIGLQLLLVVATRQSIYRLAADPLWSWLPFLIALLVHPLLFPWGRRERWLAAAALSIGTALEVLYIQVGGLHRYDLGWLGGVPLWIVLWWAVAVLIWRDLAPRLQGLGRKNCGGRGRGRRQVRAITRASAGA